jgi:hypothetical protein
MATRKFQRKPEDFVCEWCGTQVKGTGYTDHCPSCLASKHVDINPGDRASECGGKMMPMGAVYQKGEFTITYQCLVCREQKRVRAAQDDNRDMLIKLAAARPSRPKR